MAQPFLDLLKLTLIDDEYKFKPFPKVDNASHSDLYLSTGTLSQNKEDILLKWGRSLILDFSFLEHPWPSGMKFLPFRKHILGLIHLKILPTKDSNGFKDSSNGAN